MSKPNTLRMGAAIIALMIIGAVIGFFSRGWYPAEVAPDTVPGLLWPNPKRIETFATVDHSGTTFGLDNLKGKWSLLFFGYTHCPDVCPMTLAILSSLQDRLPDDMQTLFVTMDPERDTPGRMADYISFYDDRIIGLGGSLEQVSQLAAQIGIAWGHGEPTEDGSYLVTHSSAVFMTDPEARLIGIFSPPLDPDRLDDSIDRIRNFVSHQR